MVHIWLTNGWKVLSLEVVNGQTWLLLTICLISVLRKVHTCSLFTLEAVGFPDVTYVYDEIGKNWSANRDTALATMNMKSGRICILVS